MFFLKKIFLKEKEEINLGALLDNRDKTSKEKDVTFKEVVGAPNLVEWIKKDKVREFPVFNQGHTSSCVAHSFAKILGIYYKEKYNYFVNFSPAYIYVNRFNKPNEGMYAYDAWNILKNKGVALYELLPTPKTEKEINEINVLSHINDVASIFKISSEIVINNIDIDVIASIIETTKKGVSLWFYFNKDEWSREEPIILKDYLNINNAPIKHAVAAVDYTLNSKYEKCLVIEDSAHFGGISKRLITEKFLKNRCFYAAYFMNFKFEKELNEKIKYRFYNDLYFSLNNQEVYYLQEILKYEGVFPVNIESTGYFGALTQEAVKKFQSKYNLPVTGYVGEKTRNILNKLYS